MTVRAIIEEAEAWIHAEHSGGIYIQLGFELTPIANWEDLRFSEVIHIGEPRTLSAGEVAMLVEDWLQAFDDDGWPREEAVEAYIRNAWWDRRGA